MPFDFVEFKSYKLDYDSMYDELMEQRIFKNRDIQMHYLSQWMNVLSNHDEDLVRQLGTKNAILELMTKIQNEPEIFQLPIQLKDNIIFLHFRVSMANQLSKNLYQQSNSIPLEEFYGENQCIYWTRVKESVENYASNNIPIIAVPYFNGKNNLLVIDGNHRLTYYVGHNVTHVKTLIISEFSVIEQKLLSSSFDQMLYIFNNEMVRFGHMTKEGDCDDLQMIKKSYLCGNGFQFIN